MCLSLPWGAARPYPLSCLWPAAVMPAIIVRQRKAWRRKHGVFIYFEGMPAVSIGCRWVGGTGAGRVLGVCGGPVCFVVFFLVGKLGCGVLLFTPAEPC